LSLVASFILLEQEHRQGLIMLSHTVNLVAFLLIAKNLVFFFNCPPLNCTVSIDNGFSFLILTLNTLRVAQRDSNMLNAHSEYGVSCSINITKADCVALGAYMIK
jgi:hypothetical protein